MAREVSVKPEDQKVMEATGIVFDRRNWGKLCHKAMRKQVK